jgi:hypothetical protein
MIKAVFFLLVLAAMFGLFGPMAFVVASITVVLAGALYSPPSKPLTQAEWDKLMIK